MKRILEFCMLGFIILTPLACVVEEAENGSNSQSHGTIPMRLEITASSEKTTLLQQDVIWEENDAISVFDGEANRCFIAEQAGSSSIFSGKVTPADQYFALYPFNTKSSMVGGTISMSWPSVQTATPSSFGPSSNVSASVFSKQDTSERVVMANVGCYLKFFVKNSDSGITNLKISPAGRGGISGNVTITFDEGGIPSAVSSDETSFISISPDKGTFDSGTYYAVMCPSSLPDGIKLTVTKSDSSKMTYTIAGMTRTERNVVYSITTAIDDITYHWNNWSDAASVKTRLAKASKEGKIYFTDYKYYNYEKDNTLTGKCTTYGYPLIYSCDFFKVTSTYYPSEQTAPIKNNIVKIVKAAWKHNRAIPAFSWHLENPYADYETLDGANPAKYVYGASSYPDYPNEYRYVVSHILNNVNGKGDWFDQRIKAVADIINEFVDENGSSIPIIFRLFHESEHRWAWWQLDYYKYTYCSLNDFKSLFRMTVSKLRSYCPNAQMLFCFCTDRYFSTKEKYLTAYPGDDYVDIMAYDDYYIGNTTKGSRTKQQTIDDMLARSRAISSAAAEHGKIAALFETNNSSSVSADQSEFYSTYIQTLLDDMNTQLSIVGTWAVDITNNAKKTAFLNFVRQESVLFDNK